MNGLKASDIEYIKRVLSENPSIRRAWLFGSRAMGTNKKGADVDLALEGESIDLDVIARIHSELEERSPMPYFFDIVDYTHLKHPELKEHIDRYGIKIFDAREQTPVSVPQ